MHDFSTFHYYVFPKVPAKNLKKKNKIKSVQNFFIVRRVVFLRFYNKIHIYIEIVLRLT